MTWKTQIETTELDKLVRTYGGIVAALEHGIRSDHIADPEVATVWRRLEGQYSELRPNLAVAGRILRAARAG